MKEKEREEKSLLKIKCPTEEERAKKSAECVRAQLIR